MVRGRRQGCFLKMGPRGICVEPVILVATSWSCQPHCDCSDICSPWAERAVVAKAPGDLLSVAEGEGHSEGRVEEGERECQVWS